MQKSCTPLTSRIIHASDGHPEVGSPNTSVLTIITIIKINATIQNKIPRNADTASGNVENPIIPSILYSNNFQKDHFVSPAILLTFSNSIHFVLKPTHPNKPYEKRLYSLNSRIASMNFLFIRR